MNEKFRDIDRSAERDACGCQNTGARGTRDDRDACDCQYTEERGSRDYNASSCDARASDSCGGRDYNAGSCEGGRAELLKRIQQLNFMMIEAGLFLNNQCDCEAAQVAFCDYQRRHAEAKAEYEDRFGPLTYEGVNAKRDGWSWKEGPWPWEVEDC